MKNSSPSPMAWNEIARELDYKKYSRKIEKVVFGLPNETQADFYIKREGPATCVLAMTSEREVILFEQFRPGPMKVLKEMPGGFIDSGENAIDAAARELEEETGYSGQMQFVTLCLDDAYSTMERHCFVATDCIKIKEPKYDPMEFGKVALIPLTEFRKLLQSGQLTDVEVGYLCLDFLHLL